MRLPIDSVGSSAIDRLTANPITGTVRATFASGPVEYRFTGVSRRAILAAVLMPPLSVGQWVNRHCLPTD